MFEVLTHWCRLLLTLRANTSFIYTLIVIVSDDCFACERKPKTRFSTINILKTGDNQHGHTLTWKMLYLVVFFKGTSINVILCSNSLFLNYISLVLTAFTVIFVEGIGIRFKWFFFTRCWKKVLNEIRILHFLK